MLKKRQVGKTKLQVTELGFGAATFGNLYHQIPEGAAEKSITKAMELGLNQFDTAPYYGFGLSERGLGNACEAGLPIDSGFIS